MPEGVRIDTRRPAAGWGRSARAAAALLVLPLVAAGCGYQAVRYADTFGSGNRVAVHGFRNDSLEAGVDSVVTDAFSNEFMRRGALRIVSDPAAADWVLTGAVSQLDTHNRSFSSVSFSLEYEVRMVLEVALRRRDGTEIQLDRESLRARERYLASADPEVTRTNREEAIRRVAALLASRAHDALYERAASAGAATP